MIEKIQTRGLHKLQDINEKEKTGICSNCGKVKIKIRNVFRKKINNFVKIYICSYSHRYGSINSCVMPSKNSKCEICNTKTELVFDHNHNTGKHRGWLCHLCNRLLGQAKDDIEILENAILYLKK